MKKKILILIFSTALLTAIAGTLIFKPFKSQASSFQAVFLTNNQVYFGQLKNRYSSYPILTNVYYLRSQESLQQQKESSPDLTLVKLGNELHGPVDQMKINKEHILFIEDLKPDSRVVKAIQQSQR